jgi:predicted Zn-dependent peptidase
MKKYIFNLIFLFVIVNINTINAQNKAYETIVDGVKVIVQPSGNNIVEIQTLIKGGVQNYPANKAGIESLAFTALTECGTLQHDKNSFKNQLDKVSASVYGYSSKDYAVLRMNCIKSDFETVWPLYSEALVTPKFDEKEFERIKQDAINNLKESESQPDAAIDKFANKTTFSGLDYAKDPQGSVEIIQKLTPEETKNYYQTILTRSKLVIVVVADFDKQIIENKIKVLLDGIKQGEPFEFKKSQFKVAKNAFNAEQLDLSTNYIEGIASGPVAGSPDFNAFQVAMRIFSERHFLEIRTNNGLSYAPGAWFGTGALSTARFSVSTTNPDKYIEVFNKLVSKIKTEGFKADEVADMKITYLTGFYYKNETNSAQASSIAFNEIVYGNWNRSITLVDDIKKVTPEEVNAAFKKYVGNIIWAYHGDTKKVNPSLFTNTPISLIKKD